MKTPVVQSAAPAWQTELDIVVDLMRNLSRKTDPQQAAQLYGEGLDRLKLFPADRYVAVSRRGLQWPEYRITRSTTWNDEPNPWKEKGRLPLLKGGLIAEILYSNEPRIITDLSSAVQPDDPAFAYFDSMGLLLASPHFDNGESINAGLLMSKDPAAFPMELFPRIVFQANLWGRATLNLVTQQKLQTAYDAMQRELEVVAQIQRSLLPRTLPAIKYTQIATHYQTSQQAGGDYYDFFPLPNHQWGIFIADVSGHGTPAAVLMAITHAIAHTHPGDHIPPQQVLAFINEHLTRLYTTDGGTFVTAFYAVYDPCHRRLTYSSAGHPPPRLIRDGTVQGLDGESSIPLGVSQDAVFPTHSITLQPKDRLLFYTDGIPDTFNPDGDSFGDDRLDAACRLPCVTADDLVQTILSHLQTFAGSRLPADDRTMVALAIR